MPTNFSRQGVHRRKPQLGSFAKLKIPRCHLYEQIAKVRQRIERASFDLCVVVNGKQVVLGLLTGEDLDADGTRSIEQTMKLAPVTFRPDTGLKKVNRFLDRHHQKYVLVTTPDGVLFGAAVCSEVMQASQEDGDEDEELHLRCLEAE